MAVAKPSSLLDTRVVYCGDNLEQLKNLPDACVDLIYIDPPLNSNRVCRATAPVAQQAERLPYNRISP